MHGPLSIDSFRFSCVSWRRLTLFPASDYQAQLFNFQLERSSEGRVTSHEWFFFLRAVRRAACVQRVRLAVQLAVPLAVSTRGRPLPIAPERDSGQIFSPARVRSSCLSGHNP